MTGGLRRRAVVDLALVLVASAVLALTMTYALYLLTLHRAADDHTQKVGGYYEKRLQLTAKTWEETAFRMKARLEFMRVLEAPDRWVRLRALLTAESSSPVFSSLVITDAAGRKVFSHGDAPKPPPLPPGGYRVGVSYQGSADGGIHAVVCQPIWLGADGMGALHLAATLDRGFLWQESYPNARLLLDWQGKIAAESGATDAPEAATAGAEGRVVSQRIPFPGPEGKVPVLIARVSTPPPFSLGESMVLGALIFAVQALLLWSTVKGWIRRLLPRIEWLGRVAQLYAAEGGHSDRLQKALGEHAESAGDELAAVADSMRGMIASLTIRERERLAAENRLRESEQRFREVAESAGEFIWEIDARHRYVYLSEKAADVFGVPLEKLVGASVFDYVPIEDHDSLRQRIDALGSRGEAFRRFELRICRPDGKCRWVSFTGTVVRREDGRRTGAYRGTAEDVTQHKRDVESLLLAEKVYANSDQAILITAPDATILSVNPAFTTITGYNADEAVGKNPRLFASGRHDAAFYAAMWGELRRSGAWSGEIWDRRRNGEVYPKWMSINAVRDPESGTLSHYVAIFSDITERKQNEARIEHLAYHDPLTGLPNRYALQARLIQSLADARRNDDQLALMFIDLDRFKTINDSLGHEIGDQLLVAVARRIRAALRETDTVARLGGDEFVIVVPGVTAPEDAARVAEKIIEHVGEPLVLAGHTLHTSGSIGIGLFPTDGADTDTLMRNADTAMYYAKQHGRNTYHFFAADMNAAATERLLMETQLRHAVDRGEMHLVYQPQVDLLSGKVIGAEALLRWHHPERGIVSPVNFIPVAEETGLIVPLGLWVLETACAQAAAWHSEGLADLRISVNLSVRQFRDHNLARHVAEVLERSGLPADRLELEITESAIMENAEQAIEVLRALRDQGIHIAIDDFGTGYSSLAYLKRFPVGRLKIDRSFVMDLESDTNDVAIARSIVALAQALGLSVTAEGVETPAQLEMLKTFGCAEGQGYLFSRPLTADALRAFLRPSALPSATAQTPHPRLH